MGDHPRDIRPARQPTAQAQRDCVWHHQPHHLASQPRRRPRFQPRPLGNRKPRPPCPRRHLRRRPIPSPDRLLPTNHGHHEKHRDQPPPTRRLDQHQTSHRENEPPPRPSPHTPRRLTKRSRKNVITTTRL